MGGTDDEKSYSGLFGAFPYAYRSSNSRGFRLYVVVGGLLAAVLSLVFLLALVGQIADTVGTTDQTFSFVRAFFIFVGLVVVAPVLAPVLLVARRHRRTGSDGRYDGALATTGFLYLGALYLALVVSTPAEGQTLIDAGTSTPIARALYALPRVAAVVPPALAVLLMTVVHRRRKRGQKTGAE